MFERYRGSEPFVFRSAFELMPSQCHQQIFADTFPHTHWRSVVYTWHRHFFCWFYIAFFFVHVMRLHYPSNVRVSFLPNLCLYACVLPLTIFRFSNIGRPNVIRTHRSRYESCEWKPAIEWKLCSATISNVSMF